MGSNAKTEKLGLSQFMPEDRPSWENDYNKDMEKIDKQFSNESMKNISTQNTLHFKEFGGEIVEYNPDETGGVSFSMGNGWFNFQRNGTLNSDRGNGSVNARELHGKKIVSEDTYSNKFRGDLFEGGTFSGDFYNPSSETLKKDIRALKADVSDKVLSLRPVSFSYKKDNKHSIGFIAQEVEGSFPELVLQTDKENPATYSINYIGLIAPIVALCQKQQREIDTLKGQVGE